MLTLETFLADIDAFLELEGMSPTAFGKEAVGDPNLVHDLRNGRMPGLRLIGSVQAFMDGRAQARSLEPASSQVAQ